MGQLLTDADVARLLDVSPATVARMRLSGRLPFFRPTGGRAVRMREEDVQALMQTPASSKAPA